MKLLTNLMFNLIYFVIYLLPYKCCFDVLALMLAFALRRATSMDHR
jgi:hypothetical protein